MSLLSFRHICCGLCETAIVTLWDYNVEQHLSLYLWTTTTRVTEHLENGAAPRSLGTDTTRYEMTHELNCNAYSWQTRCKMCKSYVVLIGELCTELCVCVCVCIQSSAFVANYHVCSPT